MCDGIFFAASLVIF